MNKTTTLLFFFFICKISFPQDLTTLKTYLDKNNSSLDLNEINKPNELISQVMKGKNLFVLGEGGHHQLALYDPLKTFLVYQFSFHNLKYYFKENSRAGAVYQSKYLKDTNSGRDSIYSKQPSFKLHMNNLRALYQKGKHFEIKGIDNERAASFLYSMKTLTSELNLPAIQQNKLLKSILIDTTYIPQKIENSHKFFIEWQGKFLKKYQTWQKMFLKDSIELQKLVSKDNYENIKYLLSNPQTNNDGEDRNPNMAKNLLAEIQPLDSNATYLLSIGIAHSLPNNSSSVVGILSKDKIIKDKIVVMNLFCEDCSYNGEKLNQIYLKFLKNETILSIFRNAAKTDLTIFDLSKLPAEFSYMKEYGDLILFAKHQR